MQGPSQTRQNEGISLDVIENKRSKSVTFRLPSMLMKPSDLSGALGVPLDVDGNKRLILLPGRFSGASMDV
jgi:hypothetical protein